MEPTEKAPEIEQFLSGLIGTSREETIRRTMRDNLCIPKPIGCGEPAVGFRDEQSKAEYQNSGLCQKCQDELFG